MTHFKEKTQGFLKVVIHSQLQIYDQTLLKTHFNTPLRSCLAVKNALVFPRAS